MKRQFSLFDPILKIGLSINAFFVLLPTFFLINASFRNTNDLFNAPLSIAERFDLTNYILVFEQGNFGRYFIN